MKIQTKHADKHEFNLSLSLEFSRELFISYR